MKRFTRALCKTCGLAGIALVVQGGCLTAQTTQPPARTVAPINITLKDGRVIPALGLRRDGRNLMVKITLPSQPGSTTQATGEMGYSIANIASVQFPEPTSIKQAEDLLNNGKAVEALALINPVVADQEPFKDVPGSRWAQAALLKLNALIAIGQAGPAGTLGDDLIKFGVDPEAVFAARAYLAALWIRKGNADKALQVVNEIIEKAKSPEALAAAWLAKGQCLLGKNDADGSLLAFLHVSIYYHDQKQQVTAAILGSARAYEKLDQLDRAISALDELITQFPSCPEINEAKQLQNKLKKQHTSKVK